MQDTLVSRRTDALRQCFLVKQLLNCLNKTLAERRIGEFIPTEIGCCAFVAFSMSAACRG